MPRHLPNIRGIRAGTYRRRRDPRGRDSGARSSRHHQNAQLALDHLDQHLASGEPLRRDVPPGFYLNILV
jgi:hypothetical protein